ncbi:hypothetical protein OC842_000561 [Tilletia horrida]|uniref:Uncharacterized protein n=1 Tax=Tilletia horrida TaxID=155126 RepID=A0AAN6JNB7_9BASI|nr:hypothetical protein OC842_000561 [Tilletia horrida]
MLRTLASTTLGPRGVCSCARSSVRYASSSAGTAGAAADKRLVIYRGPPAMKPYLNLLCGGIFMVTGLNVAYIAANHLSWPIFSRDPETNPPKLLPLGLRLATAMGTVLLGFGSGYFFFLVPMRSITRITVQPAQRAVELQLSDSALRSLAVRPPPAIPAGTPMVHIRTALPSFTQLVPRALLPANLLFSLRTNGWAHPDAQNKRDRVVPLDSVFRFLGKATEGMSSLEAARRKMAVAGDIGQRERKSVLLRVSRSKIAYTLESEGGVAPASVNPATGKPHNLYRVFWAKIKYSFRGKRDDSEPTEAERARKTGPASQPGLGVKEPWFLDRVRFDQLFPPEKSAKR